MVWIYTVTKVHLVYNVQGYELEEGTNWRG